MTQQDYYSGKKTPYHQKYSTHKKPRQSKNNPAPSLMPQQRQANQTLAKVRIDVEHAIGDLKRFDILVHPFRNRIPGFVHQVMLIGAAFLECLPFLILIAEQVYSRAV